MSASIRDFADFATFPGNINTDTNLYEFPHLFKKGVKGETRQWKMSIRLIKEDSKNENQTKKVNWNEMDEIEVPIKEEYITGDLPEGTIAEYWTETGIQNMKITKSAAVYTKAKNVGKKNYRSGFQSALIECRAKYLKKLEEGYKSVEDFEKVSGEEVETKSQLYFPMLAKNYHDFEGKIAFDFFVQPKLNGIRCVSFLDPKNKDIDECDYNDVVMYSRSKKLYTSNETNDAIRKAILPILVKNYDLDKNESLYLDGELYNHNKSLQQINKTRGNAKQDSNMEYWIFDIFYPHYTNETFEKRNEFLIKIFDSIDQEQKNYIKLVTTHTVTKKSEMEDLYKKYLKDNYEGIIIRLKKSKYTKDLQKSSSTRSKELLKYKPLFDAEFEIVDYKDGDKGKEKKAIIWIVQTEDGNQFSVTPNQTYEERYKIYEECEKNKGEGFKKKYKGRMLNVEYRDVSDDGIPLQAKGISIRDYK